MGDRSRFSASLRYRRLRVIKACQVKEVDEAAPCDRAEEDNEDSSRLPAQLICIKDLGPSTRISCRDPFLSPANIADGKNDV